MNINMKNEKGNLLIVFHGEMDEHSIKGVRDEIDEIIDATRGLKCVTFDMSDVSFIDSTGLGFVIGRYKNSKPNERNFCLQKFQSPSIKCLARAEYIGLCLLRNKE